MTNMNVLNPVLNIQRSNIIIIVANYAMVGSTYISITSANIFGICSQIIFFHDGNLTLSHYHITSHYNHKQWRVSFCNHQYQIFYESFLNGSLGLYGFWALISNKNCNGCERHCFPFFFLSYWIAPPSLINFLYFLYQTKVILC
jgi:hypothetical protein